MKHCMIYLSMKQQVNYINMNATEAREKAIWRNIKGAIRKTITENVEDGLFSATIEEKLMDMETQYNLQLLGYRIFFQKDKNQYIIKW